MVQIMPRSRMRDPRQSAGGRGSAGTKFVEDKVPGVKQYVTPATGKSRPR